VNAGAGFGVTMDTMMTAFFALLAALQPGVAMAPPQPSAPELVQRVQAFYAKTQKLRAKFRQEYTNTTFGRSSQSDGDVFVAKPGKMRWDYKRPENDQKFFVSDGEVLWVYEKTQKQAYQQSLQDQILPVAVTFLYGEGDLSGEFNAALDPGRYGQKGDHVVKLTPKKPEAQYKHLWLVIDPGDFHVKESIIQEASDNLNHFRFYDVRLNAASKIEDKLFKFTPPAGTKIIKPEAIGK
jgi:outer membrane lipoprotein carrier protein